MEAFLAGQFDIGGIFQLRTEISIETEDFLLENGEKTKINQLCVMSAGKVLYSVPVTPSAALDKVCLDVNTMIKRKLAS